MTLPLSRDSSRSADAFRLAPYHNRWLNVYCSASRGAFFAAALVLVIHVHNPPKWRRRDTQALYGVSACFGALCGLAQHYLLLRVEAVGRRFVRTVEEAQQADPHANASLIASSIEYEFESPYFAEMALRILRTEIPDPSPPLRVAVETIFLVATRQFSDSPLIFALLGNYRMFVLKDVNSAQSTADRAALLTATLVERSIIARLRTEVAARTVNDGRGSENTMDLAQCALAPNTRPFLPPPSVVFRGSSSR